jgi:hypothetical protein
MRLKFGTKTIRLVGLEKEGRKSIAYEALFAKSDTLVLIEHYLELCKRPGVIVPAKEQSAIP